MKTKEQIMEFISNQKVAFIASVDEDGYPNQKAMLMPRKIDGNCFYFTTNTPSMRVKQYRNNAKASIYFFNKGRFSYEGVMLIGTMEVLENDISRVTAWIAKRNITKMRLNPFLSCKVKPRKAKKKLILLNK